MSMLRCNTFRVKLYAMDGQGLVGKPHDDAIITARRHLKAVRYGIRVNGQGMITRGSEGFGNAGKQRVAVMADFRHLAVHQRGRMDNFCAKTLGD